MVRIAKTRKDLQKSKVRRDLSALARRGELTPDAFETLALGYDRKAMSEARRYAKRLSALFRVGLFSPYEVAGGKWEQIERRAFSVWHTPDGQLLPRYLYEEELQRRVEQRPSPKRERPFCAAICLNGKPCRAKAELGRDFCLKHRKARDELEDFSQ